MIGSLEHSIYSKAQRGNGQLSSRLFYGIIACGFLLGTFGCALGGWIYLEFGNRMPTGHRIWESIASVFVIPISAMVGATFGGLLGFVVAVLATLLSKDRSLSAQPTSLR
jgi:hypothetical protein